MNDLDNDLQLISYLILFLILLIIYIILEQASVNAHFPPQNVGLAQLNIENMHLQYKCPLQVITGNYGRQSFSKYGISYYTLT
jgi:uncharacterized integral membrane protein